MEILQVALVFAAMLGIMISVHELGHLLVAKLFKIKITTFSIGFGKKLLKFKWGETEYCLSLIPLGGYVKFAGKEHIDDLDPNEPENPRYIVSKPTWQRFCVCAAGVTFNVILAVILATTVVYSLGIAVPTNTVKVVFKKSPAEKAGLKAGDKVIALNNQKVETWDGLVKLIIKNEGQAISLTVSRKGRTLHLTVVPRFVDGRYIIGIGPDFVIESIGLPEALKQGVKETASVAGLQTGGLVKIATGEESSKNLGGPIMIFQIIANAMKEGWLAVLWVAAVLNVVLAVVNLLPIPALDGGHILFTLVEMVRRKPLSKKNQEAAQAVGVMILLFIILYATMNDVLRLAGK